VQRNAKEDAVANRAVMPDRDAVVCEVEIAAPPARVFQALTDPAQARQWGSNLQFEITLWEMQARLGGKWRFISKEKGSGPSAYNVSEFDHHGELLEIDPPRLLLYSWFANWHEDPSHKTVVRWELTPAAAGTRLKVTHSGLAQLPKARKDYAQGWPGMLQLIKSHSEK
jgi:uncharacterized protein YndB with AHSA1/START domain